MKTAIYLFLIMITPTLLFCDIYDLQYRIILVHQPGTEYLDDTRKNILKSNKDESVVLFANDLYENGVSFTFNFNIDISLNGSHINAFSVKDYSPPNLTSQYFNGTSYPLKIYFHFSGRTLYEHITHLNNEKNDYYHVSSNTIGSTLTAVNNNLKIPIRQIENLINSYNLLNKYTDNRLDTLTTKPKILTVGDLLTFKYGDQNVGSEFRFSRNDSDYILTSMSIYLPFLTEIYSLENNNTINQNLFESNSNVIKNKVYQQRK